MEKFVPDIYQKSIYTINYDSLILRGVKCLLFDLDNTLVPITDKKPDQKIKDLFVELKDKGFKIIIFSNSSKKRLKPFKEELGVDCCARACKPSPKKFVKVMSIYNFEFSEVAIIGDSIMDDIRGGNRVGITTILINQIGKKEFPYAWLKRKRENKILKKLRKLDLFTKGRYYD
ncbi:MAG: YqeG family HAD IIIA-type phosphatase [Bacilli bacterium]|nr:YqeG family HAD IIIA-type phosphatase [Bacilli bacterium]